ncbi:helix-turn-helix transcriptional regulator [Clostridium sp. MD294]|uniref:helix-turn-helix domain-containing protein n=1 Tax=Clostridium sp. MD294 TaxID=97138 RepID=UPI0002CC4679|nr:helix-turn-helix transcriptional regulator [Clostridium sp. MD294]NDO46015.1 helix-turn-helix transcriptional regulator [Clostridium sp. MD294]USF30321.1 hypothetical protein C820_001762 [Clostridium sp. MD294]
MSLAENVRTKRKQAKMTQKQLAKKVGVTSSYISQIENDIKDPTMRVGGKIAKVLGCTLDDLIKEKSAI